MKNRFILTFLLIVTAMFNQVTAQSNSDVISVKSGVKYQYIGTYDVTRLNTILTTEADKFVDFKVTYTKANNPVKLYRITYTSVMPEFNNEPIIATGLIAIPETGKAKMPVVSYQHGTIFSKQDVPSNPERSAETRIMVAQFAGQGYIVVCPDYFGTGQSTQPDSYQVRESTQQACLDMLFASKDVCRALNIEQGPLFLSGWSMGSWSALLFLKKLESLNITVKAVAVACTPTDVFALINRWVHAPSSMDATWLPGVMAYQLNSYQNYYKLPGLVQWGIKPEYQQAALDFYQNKITFEQFYSKTTTTLVNFLTPEFISSSSTGDNRYWQIIQENNSYRFRSNTPINMYYGESDEVIPIYIGTLPSGYQQLIGGAQTTSISAGKLADHRGTFKFGVEHQKRWFDSMLP